MVVNPFFLGLSWPLTMWVADMSMSSVRPGMQSAQRGVVAVEFAVVALVFFMVVFGAIELARIMYMYNTLADVTRTAARAAANIDWNDSTALDRAKQAAIFRDTPGQLPFGAPITDKHIRIDYLYLEQQSGTVRMKPISGAMPACPGRNRHNCLTTPYASASVSSDVCIRLVRARICKLDSADCENVNYQTLFSLFNLDVPLPTSTTIVTAETLGYHSGDPICT